MSRSNRKPYTGSKAVDPSCRGHGCCPACKGNREHKNAKRVPAQEGSTEGKNINETVS